MIRKQGDPALCEAPGLWRCELRRSCQVKCGYAAVHFPTGFGVCCCAYPYRDRRYQHFGAGTRYDCAVWSFRRYRTVQCFLFGFSPHRLWVTRQHDSLLQTERQKGQHKFSKKLEHTDDEAAEVVKKPSSQTFAIYCANNSGQCPMNSDSGGFAG
jgi:hypothetical protein